MLMLYRDASVNQLSWPHSNRRCFSLCHLPFSKLTSSPSMKSFFSTGQRRRSAPTPTVARAQAPQPQPPPPPPHDQQQQPPSQVQQRPASRIPRPLPLPKLSNFSTRAVPNSAWSSVDFMLGAGMVVFQPSTQRIVVVYETEKEYWFLPRGRKDVGESLEQAALREAYEEVRSYSLLMWSFYLIAMAIVRLSNRVLTPFKPNSPTGPSKPARQFRFVQHWTYIRHPYCLATQKAEKWHCRNSRRGIPHYVVCRSNSCGRSTSFTCLFFSFHYSFKTLIGPRWRNRNGRWTKLQKPSPHLRRSHKPPLGCGETCPCLCVEDFLQYREREEKYGRTRCSRGSEFRPTTIIGITR